MPQGSARESVYEKIDQQFRAAIERELNAKGYRMVDKENADFLLDYSFGQSMIADQGGLFLPATSWRGLLIPIR